MVTGGVKDQLRDHTRGCVHLMEPRTLLGPGFQVSLDTPCGLPERKGSSSRELGHRAGPCKAVSSFNLSDHGT